MVRTRLSAELFPPVPKMSLPVSRVVVFPPLGNVTALRTAAEERTRWRALAFARTKSFFAGKDDAFPK